MKRLIPMILTALLLFTGCAPAQAPEPAGAAPELTEEQTTYLKNMKLGLYLSDPNVLALVSFPEDAVYANDEYRLTLCAVYADYADKRLLVKVEPVSQEAKNTFDLYTADDLYKSEGKASEEVYRLLAARTPTIQIPSDNNIIYWNSTNQEVTPKGETDARYFCFTNTATDTEGYLFFPSEYIDLETGTYLAELKDVSLRVDLTPAINDTLVFDLNLPVGEEGLVLDTLTLGVLSTQITYRFPPQIRETVTETLGAHLKGLPISWVDPNGAETEFARFKYGLGDSRFECPDAGVCQGASWPHDSTSFPTDQVASLTIDGVTYLPRT